MLFISASFYICLHVLCIPFLRYTSTHRVKPKNSALFPAHSSWLISLRSTVSYFWYFAMNSTWFCTIYRQFRFYNHVNSDKNRSPNNSRILDCCFFFLKTLKLWNYKRQKSKERITYDFALSYTLILCGEGIMHLKIQSNTFWISELYNVPAQCRLRQWK